MKKHVAFGLLGLLGGCATFSLPMTQGERLSGSSYVPVDPLPVVEGRGIDCPNYDSEQKANFRPLLESLPDNAVRIAITEVTGSGRLALGSSGIGTAGRRYEVILDYINVDTVNVRYEMFARVDERQFSLFDDIPEGARLHIERIEYGARGEDAEDFTVVLPVNVGVGLRLTASITVRSGQVNLASLGAITAAAEANDVSGSLVVQTLGITGRQVTTALPMPSELNSTTVQNAILSMGAIKAMLYGDGAIITPRVTGFRNPLGDSDSELINLIVSELARDPVPWWRPCVPTRSAGEAAPP